MRSAVGESRFNATEDGAVRSAVISHGSLTNVLPTWSAGTRSRANSPPDRNTAESTRTATARLNGEGALGPAPSPQEATEMQEMC